MAARRRTAWVLGSVVVVLGIPVADGVLTVAVVALHPLTALKCNTVWVRESESQNVGCLTWGTVSGFISGRLFGRSTDLVFRVCRRVRRVAR